MTDASELKNEICVQAELRQQLPRKIRLAGKGIYYFFGSISVSVLILVFAFMVFLDTAKEVKAGKDLARDGRLAYTSDVQSGGRNRTTVYYTFTDHGRIYRGEALLPHRYLDKIKDYSESGNFPVLFLPSDPTVNHPNDWQDDESYSSAFISYVLFAIVIVQWFALIRFVLRDRRLVRNGVVAIGRVTKSSLGRNGGIQLKYEFRDSDGLLTEGRGEYPTRQQVDAQIPILYLPEESGKSRPYPLVFFRAVNRAVGQ